MSFFLDLNLILELFLSKSSILRRCNVLQEPRETEEVSYIFGFHCSNTVNTQIIDEYIKFKHPKICLKNGKTYGIKSVVLNIQKENLIIGQN